MVPTYTIISSYVGHIFVFPKSQNRPIRAKQCGFALCLLILESVDREYCVEMGLAYTYNQYLITNKVKKVSFKIMHKMYPVKHRPLCEI